jgi:hypothetical protein
MDTRRRRRGIRWLLAALGAVVAVGVGMEIAERDGSTEAAATEGEPAHVEHIEGSDLSRVTFTEAAAERVQLRTVAVEERGGATVVPYSAVIYDETGRTWVYTSPEPLTFVRAEIAVDAIRGDRARLIAGPPAGTDVVAVGAAEVYGSEFEVAH